MGQLTAEERNLPHDNIKQCNWKTGHGFHTEAAVEELTAEEKNLRQERKGAENCDTIQEEDSKQAAEEGSTQENVLHQDKKTEVSWVENKGCITGPRQLYFSGSYQILKLVNHL